MKRLFRLKSINPFFVFIYKVWTKIDNVVRRYVVDRIRVYGVSELSVEEIKFKMFSKFDDNIVDLLFFTGKKYSEIAEVKLFKAFSKHSVTVLDIGANTGLYSIVAKLSNPVAIVHAFEPYKVNVERFMRNIEINRLADVNLINEALGDKNQNIEFAIPEIDRVCDVLSADLDFTNRFYRKYLNYKSVTIKQITLDSFVKDNSLKDIDLIKIDVENYELSVLKGVLETLRVFKPIIFIEIFVDKERIEFFNNELKPLGYCCYGILSEGLVKMNSLYSNPDCRNFIFCKTKSNKEYLSYSKLGELIKELKS